MKTRTFVIPLEPSVADPVWEIACWEKDVSGEPIQYSDFSEVLNCIQARSDHLSENKGYAKAIKYICQRFGVDNIAELEKMAP